MIMCTGNSCRSIIAEALINKYLDGFKAYSCGIESSGYINSHTKKVLQKYNAWHEGYHSKNLDEIIEIEFDLVVTVCDHARETCPIFPKSIKKIHVGFSDPNGKKYEEFEKTYQAIKSKLLLKVKEALR